MDLIAFRQPKAADADAVTRIDADGLATGHATFRDAPHDWESFETAFLAKRGLALVALHGDAVVGWAGVSPSSSREVYRGVGEVSIYIDASRRGEGVGGRLLSALIAAAEEAGYWTLTAQIFPENGSSFALHEAQGFRRLGARRRLGRMTYGPLEGEWRDVIMLERRSSAIGCDDP